MAKINNSDLLASFRKARNQCELPFKEEKKRPKTSTTKNPTTRKKKSPYDSFFDKYEDLENCIDDFNALDLVYFFVEKAKSSGIRYVVANYAKETACAKKLLKSYSAREICLMIEFLFESEQTYLKKDSLSITVLTSSWCNKIFRDSLLWVDDKYVDSPPTRSFKKKTTREWTKSKDSKKSAKIGEWE